MHTEIREARLHRLFVKELNEEDQYALVVDGRVRVPSLRMWK